MTRASGSKITYVALMKNGQQRKYFYRVGYSIKIQKISFTPKDTFWYPFNTKQALFQF
jgi:hypothetical protein